MSSLTFDDARCAALFVSGLQRSDGPNGDALAAAASQKLRQLGVPGCVALMAQEFGDHPEAAMDRMQWIRQMVRDLAASPVSRATAAIAA